MAIFLLSVVGFSIESTDGPRQIVFEKLISNEGNEFLVPCPASLLDPSNEYGLNLQAIDLRYDVLFRGNYFGEKGHNKEDVSVDIRNLRQLQKKFGSNLQEAKPHLRYLRVEFAAIANNKLVRMENSTSHAELASAYEELKIAMDKADKSFNKLTSLNYKGMELSREAVKDNIIKILGREQFPHSGVTREQLDLVPSLK